MHALLTPIAVFMLAFSVAGSAATLERVKASNTFRIGYRADARPFAYTDLHGAAAGYSVDLCRRVAVNVQSSLSLDGMKVEYVPVTADNRFSIVSSGQVDILCGATTQTLSRRELVDFSLTTFVDGASVLFRADGPDSFEGLAGKKVGVRSGTTTRDALGVTLKELGIDAQLVMVASHLDGLSRLEAGEVAAYFADRSILVELLRGSATPEKLRLSRRYFSHEPYALALMRGDSEFRLLVDRTLSDVYRSGDIESIFITAFGGDAAPTDVLKIMYLINALNE